VPLYILGSSMFGARLAAAYGLQADELIIAHQAARIEDRLESVELTAAAASA
jgi:hypothetical protein